MSGKGSFAQLFPRLSYGDIAEICIVVEDISDYHATRYIFGHCPDDTVNLSRWPLMPGFREDIAQILPHAPTWTALGSAESSLALASARGRRHYYLTRKECSSYYIEDEIFCSGDLNGLGFEIWKSGRLDGWAIEIKTQWQRRCIREEEERMADEVPNENHEPFMARVV